MATKRHKTLMELAVLGYIREQFDEEYMIDIIIEEIKEFYSRNGGSLYMFGDGLYGRLGIEKYKNDYCKTPTLCPPFNNGHAYKVSCGTNHTLVLDIRGNVWSCGRGTYGQLGNGKTHNLSILKRLRLNQMIISICCGDSHSLLLCLNGLVKSFGDNIYGQLGHGDLNNSLAPKTIEKLKKHKAVRICADNCHSAVNAKGGDLFCFGKNNYGECGVGKKYEKESAHKVKSPTKVVLDIDDEIIFVAFGWDHSVMLTRKGLVYSCGKGEMLGHANNSNIFSPKLIESLQ